MADPTKKPQTPDPAAAAVTPALNPNSPVSPAAVALAGTNIPAADPSATTEGSKRQDEPTTDKSHEPTARASGEGRTFAPGDLVAPLKGMAQETGQGGHQLLGKIANLDAAPQEVREASDKIAFAVNTGLAPKAVQGLQGLSAEEMSALVAEVINAKMSQDQVTGLLRARFPEPPRVYPGFPGA